jgi:Uncharacterised protein family (UPF0236)
MLTTTVGRIAISNAHWFSQGNHGFQISALLQELMVYVGQLDCYSKAGEILEKFLCVQVSATQVFRLTNLYGEELEKTCDFTTRSQAPLQHQDLLYVEVDGSMILTRTQGWKEVKVGRVFKSSDCLHPKGKQGYITHSQYLAQMGGCRPFSEKMEALIEDYTMRQEQMVFLSDGAPWLKQWIEDAFPKATSILDFYHLLEHLYVFSEAFFFEKPKGNEWVEQQKELLLESKVEEVLINIEALPACKRKQKTKAKLQTYLKANLDRMDYKYYKTIGCGIIGSGAVESAHRTVVQKRMKLSGQRWSKKGAGNMLNLRVIYMNQQWDKVVHLAKTNFANTG